MKKTGYKIFLECILIITNVVPTELPLEMSLAINSCVAALRSLNIFCLESFRIPFAGKLNVCCFDKTGTLTESKMDVINVKYTNQNTVDVLRTCHSLVYISKDSTSVLDANSKLNSKSFEMTGDPLEISTCEFLNKIFKENIKNNKSVLESSDKFDQNSINTIPISKNENNLEEISKEFIKSVCVTVNKKYNIKKKYLFSSELKRMSVVYENNKKYFVSCKGAPEIIKSLLVNVPEDYDKYLKFAEDGLRVIALAYKQIDNMKNISRTLVESNLLFAGFILLDCKLKEHAKETIKDLQDSNHKVIMITGDNLLTALNVAKKLGICSKDEQGIQDSDILPALDTDKFENYCVFARASPYHKEKIIEKYNKKGFFT
ncbi:MAG: HAD-IC family P-type ATPase, partial [Lactobacillaceae bacterium]